MKRDISIALTSLIGLAIALMTLTANAATVVKKSAATSAPAKTATSTPAPVAQKTVTPAAPVTPTAQKTVTPAAPVTQKAITPAIQPSPAAQKPVVPAAQQAKPAVTSAPAKAVAPTPAPAAQKTVMPTAPVIPTVQKPAIPAVPVIQKAVAPASQLWSVAQKAIVPATQPLPVVQKSVVSSATQQISPAVIAGIPRYKPEDYKYLIQYKPADPLGPSTFDLIKKDLKDGKIDTSEYFLQKIYHVLGTHALNPKYYQQADERANDAMICGLPVFTEMQRFLKEQGADPKAAAGIKEFFKLPELKLPQEKTDDSGSGNILKSREPTSKTRRNCTNDNYCKFPSEETVEYFSTSHSGNAPINNAWLLAQSGLLDEMANVNGCICAQADQNTVVEVYFNTATFGIMNDGTLVDSTATAELIATYLETDIGGEKPWPKIRANLYPRTTSDPQPWIDMSQRPASPGASWSIEDTTSEGRPYQIYVMPIDNEGVTVVPIPENGSRSVILIKPRSGFDAVSRVINVPGRLANFYELRTDQDVKGTIIHEISHAFEKKFLGTKNDFYEEGLVAAMENIDPGINDEFVADASFLRDKLGKNIYELLSGTGDDLDAYSTSLFFRYLASLAKKQGNYPYHNYLLAHDRQVSNQILHGYLSQYGATFAVSNLNIKLENDKRIEDRSWLYYKEPFERIIKYFDDDPLYPDGFSVPDESGEKVVMTLQPFDNSSIRLETLSIGPGSSNYLVYNYFGERLDHKRLIIKHDGFTKADPDVRLGVVLIHVDENVQNDNRYYDGDIFGDIGHKPILSAKYYEYKAGEPNGAICLDKIEQENERPNIVVLVAANNSMTETATGTIEVEGRPECNAGGGYVRIRGTAGVDFTETSNLHTCLPEEDHISYKQSIILRGLKWEQIDLNKLPDENDALGSKRGILGAFRLTGIKLTVGASIQKQKTANCIEQGNIYTSRCLEETTCECKMFEFLYPPINQPIPINFYFHDDFEGLPSVDFSQGIIEDENRGGDVGPVRGRLILYDNGMYMAVLSIDDPDLSIRRFNVYSTHDHEFIFKEHSWYSEGEKLRDVDDPTTWPTSYSMKSYPIVITGQFGTQNSLSGSGKFPLIPWGNQGGLPWEGGDRYPKIGISDLDWRFDLPSVPHLCSGSGCPVRTAEPKRPAFTSTPPDCDALLDGTKGNMENCGKWMKQIFRSQ